MSSGLHFLCHQDFFITQGNKGNILCTRIPGFSLILFYSTYCSHCQNIIPIFKQLPGTINGCQFGMVNVSQNKPIINMSKDTITPLTYVPYILLYVYGKPYMVYKGPFIPREIGNFVIDVANNIQKKQQFSEKINIKADNKNIPEYCSGVPLCGDDNVCYLEEQFAYEDRTNNK